MQRRASTELNARHLGSEVALARALGGGYQADADSLPRGGYQSDADSLPRGGYQADADALPAPTLAAAR